MKAGVDDSFLQCRNALRRWIVAHDSLATVNIELGIRHSAQLIECGREAHCTGWAIHVGDLERNRREGRS
jgi:hypothetical protein